MGFCSNCDNWVYSSDKVCPKCGKDPNKPPEKKPVDEKVVSPKDLQLPTELSEEERKYIIELLQRNSFFEACIYCGSTNLRIIHPWRASLGENRSCCNICGYSCVPLIFKDLGEYERFFKAKREDIRSGKYPEPAVKSKPSPRRPLTAAVWSFFVPGAGQLYARQLMKGLMMFVILIAFFVYWPDTFNLLDIRPSNVLDHIKALISPSLTPQMVLFYIFWLYSILDAYFSAKAANERE